MTYSDETIDSFLEHYGVKGMQWGVINKSKTSTSSKSQSSVKKEEKKKLSPLDQAVVNKLEPLGYNEDRMRRQFGPSSDTSDLEALEDTDKKSRLTDKQKKILIGIGGVAVAGAALYGLKRYSDYKPFVDEYMLMNETKGRMSLFGLSPDDVKNLSTERLDLDPGGIVKRLSMNKETSIRDMFFASVSDEDVARYKAILPIYWEQWTGKAQTGFVVNLRAKAKITAPSERETLDIFKSLLGDNIPLGSGESVVFRDLLTEWAGGSATDDDSLAARFLPSFAAHWNDSSNTFTQAMFNRVKGLGFNAIPDINDANNLANSPHIFLDGSLFEIAGHEVHGAKQIKAAKKAIVELVMSIFEMLDSTKNYGENMFDKSNNFLEHYGVKGMRWGIRRNSSSTTSGSNRSRVTNPKKLSDEELKKAVSRMQLEKQYRELTGSSNISTRSTLKIGQKFVTGVIGQVARNTAANVLQGQLNRKIAMYMASRGN